MADKEHEETIDELLRVIKADMPSTPDAMSQGEFDQLCRNIARAIATGLQLHEQRRHSIAPEFGEPERPED